MSAKASETVRRRRVFYVPGYDPFPPRRYRELYRKEGAEQAAISGYALAMRPAGKEAGGYGWRVETEIGGQRNEALVSVLVWSDLVQESMTRGIAGTYLLLARTLWFFLASGALAALARLRPGSMIAAFWPVVLLMGQLLAGLLAGGAVWALLGLALGLALPGWLAQGLGALAGAAVLVGVLRAFRKRDGRFYAYYMLYDFAHMAAWRGAWPEDLSARLSAYADQVLDALSEGYDEVLIVGHSSGAALAVSLAAEVERRGLPAGGAALALLTLGQAIPVQAFLPEARRLRADLAQLSASRALTWVDVTARGDGVSYWLTDPPAVCGVAPEGAHQPLVFSAAFSQTLAPEVWRAIRRRFFRVHVQYLSAFQHPRDYDYFQITAGPVALAARYAGRAPSPQVERRAFSPYRSLA